MDEELEKVRAALDRKISIDDVSSVFPILIPSEFWGNGPWIGPIQRLRSPKVGLTWVILSPDQTMVYVNHDTARLWERNGLEFKEIAHENLKNSSTELLWTHEKRSGSGTLLWAVMMHEDGLGSSRTLLGDLIRDRIGGEYQVGIPDRSCALIFPQNAVTADEVRMAADMFKTATSPVMGDLLNSSDLGFQNA